MNDVMEALLADSGIRRGFSQAVLAEAAKVAPRHEQEDPDRVDLRGLYTFTVDPVMAQDFDDALSFVRTAEGLTTVYVHIADVSYFVDAGTALDREALRRGNSVYVATGVEPMLPALLSSGVCSLRPGEDRKTVTVEMEVDDHGRVRMTRFYRSLIRSDARLDYEQVERMFHDLEPIEARLAGPLGWGRELSRTLRQARQERGSLRVESVEPEFEWDDDGRVAAADPGEELESHWFIEVFMVLANEQVASFLEKERVPAVYRVHDLPDPFHVDHLLDVLSSLGLPTPLFDPMAATSDDVRRVTREVGEWIDTHAPAGLGKAALTQQVLRAQARAVYQTVNIGHFGLASPTYCHFTSPIRRYPDLLVHRALLGRLGLASEPSAAFLSDWAEHCSQKEREAAKIELKADDIVLAHLLKRRLDEENGWGAVFEGQVLSLTRRGMFILFDRLFQGYLSAGQLPRDDYRLNELETALEGRRSSRAYRLADRLRVRVLAVDEVRGRVDLALADGSGKDAEDEAREGGNGLRLPNGAGSRPGRNTVSTPSHGGSGRKVSRSGRTGGRGRR
jgi:ribonuclease R